MSPDPSRLLDRQWRREISKSFCCDSCDVCQFRFVKETYLYLYLMANGKLLQTEFKEFKKQRKDFVTKRKASLLLLDALRQSFL